MNTLRRLICKIFNHNWSETSTWYTFLGVPYDHCKCQRCGTPRIVRVYSKDMEQEMIDYNNKQGI